MERGPSVGRLVFDHYGPEIRHSAIERPHHETGPTTEGSALRFRERVRPDGWPQVASLGRHARSGCRRLGRDAWSERWLARRTDALGTRSSTCGRRGVSIPLAPFRLAEGRTSPALHWNRGGTSVSHWDRGTVAPD